VSLRAALALGIAALLAGCASAPQSRYAWGSYEDLIYTVQARPGTLSPQAQADQMEKDRQSANAAQHRLPPGWHAQLAYVYAQSGKLDLARQELQAEKAEFPEATTLVDRLLANLGGSKP
jgi:hypothetical protein